MTADQWQEYILCVVAQYVAGERADLKLLAGHLEMCDQAKQALRDRGYGWTGLDILETARLVPAVNSASTGTTDLG